MEVGLGTTVAEAIRGSWRQTPPVLEWGEATLGSVIKPLIASGCAFLVWHRIRNDKSLISSANGASLHNLWRMNVLKVAEQRRQLALVLTRLAKVKIQAILLKGLSAANLYPDPRWRPVGDIDFYISSEQIDDAKRVIAELYDEQILMPIDLKHEASIWTSLSFSEVLKRCGSLDVCGSSVRVLGPEDNLRFLCLHFLQHGGGRALWLCDVAAAVENRPAGFDWDLFRYAACGTQLGYLRDFACRNPGRRKNRRYADRSAEKEATPLAPENCAEAMGIQNHWQHGWPGRSSTIAAGSGRIYARASEALAGPDLSHRQGWRAVRPFSTTDLSTEMGVPACCEVLLPSRVASRWVLEFSTSAPSLVWFAQCAFQPLVYNTRREFSRSASVRKSSALVLWVILIRLSAADGYGRSRARR